MRSSLLPASAFLLLLSACSSTASDDDSSEDSALTTRAISKVTTFSAAAPRRDGCSAGDHATVDFDTSKLTSFICKTGGELTHTEKELSRADLARVRSAVSSVRKTTRPRSCEAGRVDSMIVEGSGHVGGVYNDAAGACDANVIPAKAGTIANVIAIVDSLAGAPPPPAEGALNASTLTIIENLPEIAEPRARLLAGPSSGEIALYTMRRGAIYSQLVSSLPNVRHMQRYRAWDLRALGGQLVDYLYDPGLHQEFIRVTEGNRTAIFGPWAMAPLSDADERATRAQLVLPIGYPAEPVPMDWYDGAVLHCLFFGKRIDTYLVTNGGRRLVVDQAPIHLLPDDPRVIVSP